MSYLDDFTQVTGQRLAVTNQKYQYEERKNSSGNLLNLYVVSYIILDKKPSVFNCINALNNYISLLYFIGCVIASSIYKNAFVERNVINLF